MGNALLIQPSDGVETMRFEEQVDNIVLRYPEVRVYGRQPTSPRPFTKEVADGVALGHRLHGKFLRETATTVFVKPILAVVRKFARDYAYRVTLRSLRDLEDHRLQDIGIERRDIRPIAKALAYGETHHKARLTVTREAAKTKNTFEIAKAA
jgi:uncharacterized protein YjiS (DUF1127 family)